MERSRPETWYNISRLTVENPYNRRARNYPLDVPDELNMNRQNALADRAILMALPTDETNGHLMALVYEVIGRESSGPARS